MNKYKLFSGLVAVALLAVSAEHTLALTGGPTLAIQTSPSSIAVNGQFTANIVIDTKTYSVSAAELNITFPADKLQALSIAAGSFLPNALVPGSTGNGTASITVASGTSAKQGTGVIAVITFKALAAGTAQIGFAASTQVAAVGQSSNVVDTMTPASEVITASDGSTVAPTPISTPTPSSLVASSTPTPSSSVSEVGTVSTGPGETAILALIIGCIAALLYVGYTGTRAFKRREIGEIADDEMGNPPDFKQGP